MSLSRSNFASLNHPNERFSCHLFQCTASCGDGVSVRTVTCVSSSGIKVHEGRCPGDTPVSERPCHSEEECYRWKATSWTQVRFFFVGKRSP